MDKIKIGYKLKTKKRNRIKLDKSESIIINLTPFIETNPYSDEEPSETLSPNVIYTYNTDDQRWVRTIERTKEIKDSNTHLMSSLNKENGYVKVINKDGSKRVYYVNNRQKRTHSIDEQNITIQLNTLITEENPFYFNKELDESVTKLIGIGLTSQSFQKGKQKMRELVSQINQSKSEEDIHKQLQSIQSHIGELSKGLFNVTVGLVGLGSLIYSNGKNVDKLRKQLHKK